MVVVAIVEINYVIAISFLIAGLNSDFLNFIYGSRITGHMICHISFLFLKRLCVHTRSVLLFILDLEHCQNLYFQSHLLTLNTCDTSLTALTALSLLISCSHDI